MNQLQIQIEMIWDEKSATNLKNYSVPAGYLLRTYQPGDEPGFYHLLKLVGWQGWDDEKLKPWLYRIVPDGWYMIVEKGTSQIVASSMATHDPTWREPFSAEIGWVSCHPEHTGKGPGIAGVAAATNRLVEAGYKRIHLYTEPFRLPAIWIYFKLGYLPIWQTEVELRQWRKVCDNLDVAFTPEIWQKKMRI